MRIKINGAIFVKDDVADGALSILQACEEFGFNIPKFCYHPKLSIAGNCRMCLVEVEGAPKPVASCAMPQGPTTSVYLDTPLVKKARENVMEFLLLNHPLDCPVCDQGGECDLQDEALYFGNDKGRFYSMRRSVVNKNTGPLVKMVMTRCIHCTRCVRFCSEVGGFEEFGATGRGNSMEIGPYIDKILKTELSGNVIDLCPVGALTSKPYNFSGRPWESKSMDSIDITDAMGAPIVVQLRKNVIAKITPKDNSYLSFGWIHDRIRFCYDGILLQRIGFIYTNLPGRSVQLSVSSGMALFKNWFYSVPGKINSFSIVPLFIFSTDCGDNYLFFFKKLSIAYANLIIFVSDYYYGIKMVTDFRYYYKFNTGYNNYIYSDSYALFGTDLRYEYPLLHTQLLNAVKMGSNIVYFGKFVDSRIALFQKTVTADFLGVLYSGLFDFCKILVCSIRPTYTIGTSIIKTTFTEQVIPVISTFSQYTRSSIVDGLGNLLWMGLNRLLYQPNQFLGHELNLGSRYTGLMSTIGAKNLLKLPKIAFQTNFCWPTFKKQHSVNVTNIFIGTHAKESALASDLVIPVMHGYETKSSFYNNEGYNQAVQPIVSFEGEICSYQDFDNILLEDSSINYDITYSCLSTPDNDFSQLSFSQLLTISIVMGSLLKVTDRNFYQTGFMAQSSVHMAKARSVNYPKNFHVL